MTQDADQKVEDLVRQALDRRAQEVDADGMLQNVRSRRRRRKWPGRVALAAAAALLVAVGILTLRPGLNKGPLRGATTPITVRPLQEALFSDAAGLWDIVRTAGLAGLEAGEEPVRGLSDIGPSLTTATDRLDRWMGRTLPPAADNGNARDSTTRNHEEETQ